MMKFPRLYIGPMSKNVVEAVIEFSNEREIFLGLIPSRRQVEHTGGYVNNWTTDTFVDFVKKRSSNIVIERDHGGPGQGNFRDSGILSISVDVKTHFDLIHVDPWKEYKDIEIAAEETINLINHCLMSSNRNNNVMFEVGTEEAIRKYSPEELKEFLYAVKKDSFVFSKIKYAVVQFGTSLRGSQNTGTFDYERAEQMIKVCRKFGVLSKEHNGDYLALEGIKNRFSVGLDAINIAPEFGNIETRVYLENADEIFFNKFYQLCFDSKRWVKWFPSDFVPEENKRALVEASGHYVFSHPEFLALKSSLKDIDDEVKSKVKDRLEEICAAIKQ